MRLVTEEIETFDDAAVEMLLAQARQVAEEIDRVLNHPVGAESEMLHATADPELLKGLKAARELAESPR